MSRFERKMISLLLSLTLVFGCFNLGALNVKAMEAGDEIVADEVVADDIETSGELEADEQQPSEEVADVTEEVTTEDALEEESVDGEDAETDEQTDDCEVEESDKGYLENQRLGVGESIVLEAGAWYWSEAVTWTCDNTDVVRIESNGRSATIYALAPGNAHIVARTEDGGEDVCTIEVYNKYGDFTYEEVVDGTIKIVGYSGKAANVAIPSTINGRAVSIIGSASFYSNQSIEKVTVPKTVTLIQYEAFSLSTLNNIEFESGSSLSIIDHRAFSHSKLKSITIPNKVEKIGENSFRGCEIKEITIPDSVKNIGSSAFSYCESLETVKLSNSITEISGGLFYECRSLKNVSVPSNVEKIGGSAFYLCEKLESITLPNKLTSIGDDAFYHCGLKTIVIPDSVTAIGKYAFAWNEHLTKAVLSNNLIYIERGCFSGCPITELKIGDKTKKIGVIAFSGNSAITAVTIPNSVTDLQYKAFANCEKLKNINFSSNLTKVSGFSLDGTEWYNSQPRGVAYAGPVAYKYKGEAADNVEISIKDKTNGIASFAFYKQKGITSIKLNDGLKVINNAAFLGCSLNSVKIPSSVTEIGNYALGYELSENGENFRDEDEFSDWLKVKKRDNFKIYGTAGTAAETYAKKNGFKFIEVPTTANVYIHEMSRKIIIAGLVLDVNDKSNLEFSWDASSDGGATWKTVSDWRVGHEWLDWTPDNFGDYVIVGKVRVKGEKEVILKATANVSYHPHIKGKCQMPYSGEQGIGYLIGVESYDNPGQKYQYEMLILDCTLLAQGLPAWTYTTGQFRVPEGNAGWCIWTPQYGYYWTLFRVYDENGVLIDEECFGFANIC